MRSTMLFFASLLASALALPVTQREVVAPTILNPTTGTVWTVGSTQVVSWNTSELPPYNEQTNPIGTLLLGYETTDPSSENLMLSAPLASGFNLSIGSIEITVPNVPDGTLYILDLMGDSGNVTPDFTIQGGTATGDPVSYMLSSSAATPSYTAAPSNAPATLAASTTAPPVSPSLQTAASSSASSVGSTLSSGASAASSLSVSPGGPASAVSSATSSVTPTGSTSTSAASTKSIPSLALFAVAGLLVSAMI